VRILGSPLVALTVAAFLATTPVAQSLDATQVLASARQALGGDKNLAAVKTFVATGRTRQVRGNNLVPIEFEISCDLPDKYVRVDEFPAQDADPTTLGFNGDALIQFPAPPPGPAAGRAAAVPSPSAGRDGAPSAERGRAAGPPLSPAQQRVINVKQDFARLMLGAFASGFPSYPLTFRYAGEGDAPDGKADVLDVGGPANFSVRLVVQRNTHLPVMLMWQVPASTVVVCVPGQPTPGPVPPGAVIVDAPSGPPSTASQADRDQYAATLANLRRQALMQAKPTEYRLYYADFRDVDGVKWPFRLRRAIAGDTIEETTFDRIRINAKIDPQKFEASK
jgi:hypothetical protein